LKPKRFQVDVWKDERSVGLSDTIGATTDCSVKQNKRISEDESTSSMKSFNSKPFQSKPSQGALALQFESVPISSNCEQIFQKNQRFRISAFGIENENEERFCERKNYSIPKNSK
jgi:hypothetical protein